MDLIEELTRKLQTIPNARYESDASSITVFPNDADGFTVSLVKNSNGHTVFFNGWHEDFEDVEETLSIFGLGLSNECRLREYRRGGLAYKWTVELLEDGEWQVQSTSSLLLFPFWRRANTHYLQNRLIVLNQETSS